MAKIRDLKKLKYPPNKGLLTIFEISLILALAAVAYSDRRYFSMSSALMCAVEKFTNDAVNDSCSCIQMKSEDSERKK